MSLQTNCNSYFIHKQSIIVCIFREVHARLHVSTMERKSQHRTPRCYRYVAHPFASKHEGRPAAIMLNNRLLLKQSACLAIFCRSTSCACERNTCLTDCAILKQHPSFCGLTRYRPAIVQVHKEGLEMIVRDGLVLQEEHSVLWWGVWVWPRPLGK